MNHIYRTVFNRALGVWQVVAEVASAQGKGRSAGRSGHGGLRLLVLLPLSVWASLTWAASPVSTTITNDAGGAATAAQAAQRIAGNKLPTGGTVSAGSGSIAQSGAAMTITQNTQNLAINWQSFDIGANASVTFLQPNATAIALNRVLGGDTTHILGQLKGNGQVWVLNPNGVLFGSSAQVNVGGLVASTLGLSDADFMAGKRSFTGSGGSVVNQGSLNGGYVALLGENVRNEGTITARLGTAALAAGNRVTLDFNGDQLLNVQVDEGALHALADNRGLIQADGGSVLMTARARDALLDTAVNNTGIIRARTVANRNGRILLLGDMAGGTVNVAGTLDASAPDGGNGGFIETSAAHVKVADSAVITTKSAGGQNGKWLIDPTDFTVAKSGGDMTGAALTNALANGDVQIQSTAGASGTGGDVNIKDTVSWNQNTLTLDAQRDINVYSAMNASGTAGLFFKYGQADAGGSYNIYAPVNLASTSSFRTQSGSAGDITHWTIITSLGSETDVTGNAGTTLQGIWGNLGGNFVLGADIDASSTAGWNGGLGFTPIGGNDPGATQNPYFTGNFDGLGHVIDSLTINRPAYYNIGLFGSAFDGVIANIGLTNASITGNTTVGGLAGRTGNLSIRNSYVSGAITGNGAVGGIVGTDIFPRGSDVLDHVWTAGSVTATAASTGTATLAGMAGGLIGHNAGEIRYSYSTADVRGGNYVGGLVGSRLFGSIDKSYFAGTIGSNGVAGSDGTVKAPYAMGALVGSLYTADGVISKSYWNTDTAGAVGAGSVYIVGTGAFNGVGLTTAQMRDATNWVGFDFVTTPSQNGWLWANGVMPLLASEWSSYIRNAHQLQLMALDLSADYTLANDIDASATNGAAGDVWYGGSFSPIGTSANNAGFSGSFDGRNHTISGLTINRGTQSYVGLFGYADGAALANVNLLGASITGGSYGVGTLAGFIDSHSTVDKVNAAGTVSGTGTRVGGLVGRNEGNISKSSANVTVSGGDDVGGLVGSSSGAISNSTAAGNVTNTTGDYAGGLVGRIVTNGIVSNSSASGTVSGVKYVGGLVGYAAAAIMDSTASGTVTAAGEYAGGLAGYTTSRGTVTNSVATGAVNGQQRVGGLVGEAHAAITGSHATGKVTGSSSYVGGLVGATDAAITTSHATGVVSGASYVGGLAGWTSAALQNVYATGGVTGSGNYIGGLVGDALAAISNSHASGAVIGTDDYVGGLAGRIGAGGSVDQSQASGTVSVDDENIHSVGGLVGENNGSITASSASGTVQGGRVMGGLVGANRGSIAGSHATGNVTGLGALGGLVGENHGSIDDSHAEGAVSGQGGVGGLAGETYGAISNSYATGNVTATVNYAGGLVGYAGSAAGTITNSHASGEVKGQSRVGGLVGEAQAAITGSHATGNVTATGTGEYAGGLVGWTNADLQRVYATGAVTATGNYVGGLVGFNSGGIITLSHAAGAVQGAGTVGGLVGWSGGNVTQSYASGDVRGAGSVGGLVGQNNNSTIAQSYASGNATATQTDAGGLVGYNNNGTITQSYATGSVAGVSAAGGLVGGNGGTVTTSFFATTDASGNAINSGLDVAGGHYAGYSEDSISSGKTRAELQQLSTFASWGADIDGQGGTGAVWRIYEGSTGPLLRGFLKALTVTTDLSGNGKTYDGHIASGTAGHTTNTPADASQLLGTVQYLTTGADAGTYRTTDGTLVLAGSLYSTQQGYDISYSGTTSLTIDKAALTVTANDAGKTYDGVAWSGGNGVSYSGFVNGEDATVLGGTLAWGGNSQGAVNAGSYSLDASGLSSGNYAITYVGGTLTIVPKVLTAIVGNLTGTVRKTYDGTTRATLDASNFLLTGWVGGDGASVTQTSGQYDTANAGSGKTVSVELTLADYLAANGTDLSNYVLPTRISGNVGIIDKANATVTANSGTVTYNGQVQNVTGHTITGLVNGEDESVLDSLVATGGSGRNAGSYAHTVSGSDDNYNLTFIDGVLTIDKAALTLSSNNISKTYDGTTTANGTAIVTGGQLFGSDTLSGGNFAYTDKNAGTGKTVTVNGVTVNDGNSGNNYDVRYADNTASSILQRTLTIGGNFDVADKFHDGDNRATISRNALALQGVVAGDALAADWQALFADASVAPNKTVTLQGTTLTGGDSGNYLLVWDGAPTAIASISGVPLGTGGGRYASATRSAKSDDAWQARPASPAPAITVQQCGQNLPVQLAKDCQ